MNKFQNAYNYSDEDMIKIKKIIDVLLTNSFIMEEKFNVEDKSYKSNKNYYLCREYNDFLNDFFELHNIKLVNEISAGVYYLVGDGAKKVIPSKDTILMLLLIKGIYNDKSQKLSSMEVYCTKREIREKGLTTGLLTKKLPNTVWSDTLSFMKRHNLINFRGKVDELTDDSEIYIFNTISIYMNATVTSSLENLFRLRMEDKKEEVEEV